MAGGQWRPPRSRAREPCRAFALLPWHMEGLRVISALARANWCPPSPHNGDTSFCPEPAFAPCPRCTGTVGAPSQHPVPMMSAPASVHPSLCRKLALPRDHQ